MLFYVYRNLKIQKYSIISHNDNIDDGSQCVGSISKYTFLGVLDLDKNPGMNSDHDKDNFIYFEVKKIRKKSGIKILRWRNSYTIFDHAVTP